MQVYYFRKYSFFKYANVYSFFPNFFKKADITDVV